jgi:outer membrane lipoprotein-sorting protein
MRYLMVVLFLPAVAAAQDNEAEKLLRQLEQKLTQAKSLKVVGEVEVSGEAFKKMQATVLIAGNKVRLEMKGGEGDKQFSMEAVSDGKTVKTSSTPPGKTQERPAPKNLGPALSQLVGRGGLIALTFAVRGKKDDDPPRDINVEELLRVSDFRMGKGEKVNGRDAKVISYKVSPKDEKNPAAVTLWLDVQTLLPLKHLIVVEGEKARFTGTYTTFEINARIDPKDFELRK